jgi:hypothetical protein
MDGHPGLHRLGCAGISRTATRTLCSQTPTTHYQVNTMLWNIFGIQKLLDTLFDAGWCSLGLPEGDACGDLLLVE